MSWVLGRYIAMLALSRLLLVLFGLASVMIFLDFLADGDEVIRDGDGTLLPMLKYAGLRLPSILSQVFPVSAFLAGLLCFSGLARHGELAALQAAGVSKLALALAALPAALIVATLQFAVEDVAVPASLKELRDWGVGSFDKRDKDAPPAIWVRKGQDILRYRAIDGDDAVLTDLTIFRRDAAGNLVERIEAAKADYQDGVWILADARRTGPDSTEQEDIGRYEWHGGLQPEMLDSITAHPRETPVASLLRVRGEVGIGNQPSYLYDLWVHERFARPINTMLMLFLTVALAFPFGRQGGSGLWFAGAIGLGFSLWTLDGLFLGLGELGLLKAAVAAWTPAAVLALVVVGVALHFEYRVAARRRPVAVLD